jgi:hypothetical protein
MGSIFFQGIYIDVMVQIQKVCTTHGGGALHGTLHKFGNANFKAPILDFLSWKVCFNNSMQILPIALNDILNFKSWQK